MSPTPHISNGADPQPLHAAAAALTPDAGHGFGAVLGRSDFRYLWVAQVTSQLADKFLMYTLLLYVYAISKLALLPSILMVAYTFPSVFLSAPAGVYADRHDKRRLMLWCNVLRAVLVLIIPVTSYIGPLHDQVVIPILVTLLFSSAGQVFAPAEAASIPNLVTKPQITTATSLFITTVIITLVVAVPTATLVSAFFGSQVPFYVATGLFIVAAAAVWRIHTNLKAGHTSTAPAAPVMRELREGLGILGRSPALRLGMAELTLSLVIVFTLFALGPAYMRTTLQRSPDDIYIVLIPATIGMIVTASVLGQHGRNPSRARLLIRSIATVGGTLVAIGIGPALFNALHWNGLLLPLVVLAALIFGVALGGLLIPAFTVLQERTDEESRGRIFGGIFTVINASVALPLLLAGGLADIFHVDRVLTAAGILLVLGGVVAQLKYRQALSVLERDAI